MPRREELQDEQWVLIEPLLPKISSRADGRGRPRYRNRAIPNGVLWILRSGARWKDLPERVPSYRTCHRRFQHWVEDGTLCRTLSTLADDLRQRNKIDPAECFIDGTFTSAKKRGCISDLHPGCVYQSFHTCSGFRNGCLYKTSFPVLTIGFGNCYW